MTTQRGHSGGGHREGLRPCAHHQVDKPRDVLVRHEAREQLGQLGLEISVELGLNVKPE